ncbi:Fe-S cluster assembly protein HesB [Paenibacillus antri]|uniref:Fe-S cluster assembly protein HesB n=1 Tax=Paenibacillus antri TaxID=2582848 RepID=A0A5R9GC49_9BACL|nr:Fe-S cluster assembly protein HesB [Paenibacillus antri]TLS53321.1 Fe-S cluster assembly protein HesB [Paenibacillus antri]
MKLEVTERAVACLQGEWGFEPGEFIRVYARYAGGGAEPYVLGIQKERPRGDGRQESTVAGGMTFFIEEGDMWFVQDKKVTIDATGPDIQFVLE